MKTLDHKKLQNFNCFHQNYAHPSKLPSTWIPLSWSSKSLASFSNSLTEVKTVSLFLDDLGKSSLLTSFQVFTLLTNTWKWNWKVKWLVFYPGEFGTPGPSKDFFSGFNIFHFLSIVYLLQYNNFLPALLSPKLITMFIIQRNASHLSLK